MGGILQGGSHAFDMARHDMSGHGGMTSHLLRNLLKHQQDLGLTDDQVTKLKALALDQDRARIRAHADVQVAERELRALVADEKTELSVVEAKIKARETYGEGYNGARMCLDPLIRISRNLAPDDVGDYRSPDSR